jgi:hypothetical protein
MKDETAVVRYIYVSRAYMSKPKYLGIILMILFNAYILIDDVFIALGISNALGSTDPLPNLSLDIGSSEDLEDWNMRLPGNKLELVGKIFSNSSPS